MEGYCTLKQTALEPLIVSNMSVDGHMTVFLLIIINEPILPHILFQHTFFSEVIFLKCGMFSPLELVARSATF